MCVSTVQEGRASLVPDWQWESVPPLYFLFPLFLSAATSCPAPRCRQGHVGFRNGELNHRKPHRAKVRARVRVSVSVCAREAARGKIAFYKLTNNRVDCFILTVFCAVVIREDGEESEMMRKGMASCRLSL